MFESGDVSWTCVGRRGVAQGRVGGARPRPFFSAYPRSCLFHHLASHPTHYLWDPEEVKLAPAEELVCALVGSVERACHRAALKGHGRARARQRSMGAGRA